jgi:hypothetical protein
MRAHHIVVAALILIGIGVKVTVVSTMTAEADSRAKRSVDASQMQQNLPVEEFHDMTFVFPVRPGGN